jgi:hypothetical protein
MPRRRNNRMVEDSKPSTGADGSRDSQPEPSARFDSYRSFADSNLMIFVEHDIVPPFRYRAGGWELLKSAIELGPAMKGRIAEKGFFMYRVNEDKVGWTELIDLPSGSGSG